MKAKKLKQRSMKEWLYEQSFFKALGVPMEMMSFGKKRASQERFLRKTGGIEPPGKS